MAVIELQTAVAGSTSVALFNDGGSPLQFFWIFQQFDYTFEQAPGAAAVDAAMVEAQCDLRLSLWNKLLFIFIPRRNFFPSAEAEQECLIGQRNRRAPFHSERSEIRNGGDTAGLHVGRNPPLSRTIDKFLVFRRKIGKRCFVGGTNDRHHDSIPGFHGDAHVDGVRLYNAAADEFRRCAWIFRKGQRKGAQRVKAGAGLWIARLSILQYWIEIHRRTNRRERPSQLRRIASATPARMAEASCAVCFSILCIKFSRSLMVMRLPAPVGGIPARSALVSCNSSMRARTRGDKNPAPFAAAGTGNPPVRLTPSPSLWRAATVACSSRPGISIATVPFGCSGTVFLNRAASSSLAST